MRSTSPPTSTTSYADTTRLPRDDGLALARVLRVAAADLRDAGFAALAAPRPVEGHAWSPPVTAVLRAYADTHGSLVGEVARLAADLDRVAGAVGAGARAIRAADDDSLTAIRRLGAATPGGRG